MIYDLLKDYRNYLLETCQQAMAETYYKRLCVLFEGQNLVDTVGKFDVGKVLGKLGEIKHKNPFSQSKNAFLYFCKFQNIKLSVAALDKIKELEAKTIKKRRKMDTVDIKQVLRTIKHIKNEKLKVCYEVILATGLRVSELAYITAENSTVSDEHITFSFIGKGGKMETVEITAAEYPTLYQRLKETINQIA